MCSLPIKMAEIAQAVRLSFGESFYRSFFMIITTELLDKTFIIAAMLAMKHSYLIVFAGAASALVLMTVLSALMGRFIAELISPKLVHYACVGLFAIFGVKLLWEALETPEEENSEMKEVEMELKQASHTPTKIGADVEAPAEPSSLGVRLTLNVSRGLKTENARVAVQAFILTFVGEWGDRSQMATVGLAAQGDTLGVSLGGFAGHILCTALAVVGGRILATKISVQQVNFAAGILFLMFAVFGIILGD